MIIREIKSERFNLSYSHLAVLIRVRGVIRGVGHAPGQACCLVIFTLSLSPHIKNIFGRNKRTNTVTLDSRHIAVQCPHIERHWVVYTTPDRRFSHAIMNTASGVIQF